MCLLLAYAATQEKANEIVGGQKKKRRTREHACAVDKYRDKKKKKRVFRVSVKQLLSLKSGQRKSCRVSKKKKKKKQ